jgi:hypothetical protein
MQVERHYTGRTAELYQGHVLCFQAEVMIVRGDIGGVLPANIECRRWDRRSRASISDPSEYIPKSSFPIFLSEYASAFFTSTVNIQHVQQIE